MTWQQVQNNFPQQWLLIEAIQAHTEDNKRLLDQISVVDHLRIPVSRGLAMVNCIIVRPSANST